MKSKAFLIAGACLALGGCGAGAEPGVYDLPRETVYQRLASNPLDALKFRFACGILIHLRPSARNGDEIDWRVTHNGETKLQFSVRLEEVSPEQTRIKLSIDSKEADGGEFYDGDYFTRYPALAQPVRPAIQEAIAAILEGREYDPERVPRRGGDDVCDTQRASFKNDGVPIDVKMARQSGSAQPTGSFEVEDGAYDSLSDDWGQ